MRPLSLLLALFFALLVAGCGDDQTEDLSQTTDAQRAATTGSTVVATTGTTKDAPRPDGPVDLVLEYGATEEGPTKTVEVSCEPGDDDEVCTAWAEHRDDLLEEQPTGLACTEQYGGPQQARLSGTVDGEQVNVVWDRTDGCQIARWEQLKPFLDAVGIEDTSDDPRSVAPV